MCPPGVCQRGRVPLGPFEIFAIISHMRSRCYCTRYGRWQRKREMIRRGDWYEGRCDQRCIRNSRVWGQKTHDHEIEGINGEEIKKLAPPHSVYEVEGDADRLPTYDNAGQQSIDDEKPPGYESP